MDKTIKEISQLEKIIASFGKFARSEIVDFVEHKGQKFPLYVVELGSTNPSDPVVGFFGGVHGIEKIGSEVILAYMESITSLIKWDESFKKRLKHSRMLFMPIVNPVGVMRKSRSNGRGVDLMRNSPSEGRSTSRGLVKGHRISPMLPWYRGEKNSEMEVESRALCKVVKEKLFCSKMSMAIDVHSGFGARDRFWFPYSRSNDIFPNIAQVLALKDLFDKTYPNHFYVIEPTSYQYTIDGDLWDYLVDEYFRLYSGVELEEKFFLPWTLEMGSWSWLRKNPLQILNKMGLFHPLIPHRRQRIMRRHLSLFDFIQRSILFPKTWISLSKPDEVKFKSLAKENWYAR